jgi:hypothetical protein
MAYNREYWKDHVVEFPTRFKETSLGNGLVDEQPAPGEILQQGTPQSATHFNNLEEGVFAANERADYNQLQIMQLERDMQSALGVIGTVTLGNSQAYPFNNSGATIPLTTPRDTTDYFVDIQVLSVTGGAAGNLTVYNKLLNGFGVNFDGSATSVTIQYQVTGGNV